MSDYKKEVVDPGDRASKRAKDVCVESFLNNCAVEIIPRQPGNFRGPVNINWSTHILEMMLSKRMSWNIQNDGAGGKPQFFSLIGTPEVFRNLGWEIVVMVIDDIARSGDFPVVFCNDVNAKKVTDENYHLVDAMFGGLGEILKETGMVDTTGEFAVMKHSVTAFCDRNLDEQLILNWSGTGIGLSHVKKNIDGQGMKVGLPIVGFWEPGYRCNGGTKFTNLILRHWADGDVRNIWDSFKAMEFIEKLTVPSKSYAKTICRANGWLLDGHVTKAPVKMVANAHITGGGLGKFQEILPPGIGAYLNNMPNPASVLLEAQEISFAYPDLRISDLDAHTDLHGGCGWLSVCKTFADACTLVAEARKDGVSGQIVGETIKSDSSTVFVDSRFLEEKKEMPINS